MKRKLVAALLSVAMVASITPTTPFTAAATVEAATTTSAEALMKAVESPAKYTAEWKANYDAALAAYNALPSSTEKDSLATEKARLDSLGKVYDNYNTLIKNATDALNKIGQNTVTSADYADEESDVMKAVKAYEALDLSDSNDPLVSKYNFQGKVEGEYHIEKALLDKGALLAQKGTIGSLAKIYLAANAYDVVEKYKDNLVITTDNYTSAANDTNGIDQIKAWVAGYEDIIANYSRITAAENKVASYTDAVAAVVKAASEDAAFTAKDIKDDETLAKVQAAYDKVEAAIKALDDAALKTNAKNSTMLENNKGGFSGTLNEALMEVKGKIDAYTNSKVDTAAKQAIVDQIMALPKADDVTINDDAAINAAYQAKVKFDQKYPGALEKSVANYLAEAITALENKINSLAIGTGKTDTQKRQDNQARADLVLKYINQLPADPNAATLEKHEAIVNSAIKAYQATYNVRNNDTLPTSRPESAEWQKLISAEKYNLLLGCKQKMDALNDADETAYNDLVSAYQKLAQNGTGSENEGQNLTIAQSSAFNTTVAYTTITKAALAQAEKDIQAAKDAYSTANSTVKAKFDKADKNGQENPEDYQYTPLLTTLEKGVAKAKAYTETKELLSSIKLAFAAVDTLNAEKTNEAAIAQQVAAVDKLLAQAKENEYLKDNFKNWNAKSALKIAYYDVEITAANTENYIAGKDLNTTPKQEAAPVVELIKATTILDNSDSKKVYTESELDAVYSPIKAARDAYNKLSDEAQAVVSNAGRLANAEKEFDVALQKLYAEKADKLGIITAGVQPADKAIVEEIKALEEKYGITYKAPGTTATPKVQEAYSKYIATKNAIDAADEAAAQKASDDLLALVNKIPTDITKDDVASVILANDKYQALSPAAKEIFDKELAKDNKTLAKDYLAKAYEAAKVLTFDLATIDSIADQTYTGDDIEVAVTLKDANGAAISADDYVVSYVSNVEVGEATVVVNPKASSKYTGTATATFKINAASIEDAAVTGSTKTYTGKAVTTTVKVVVGDKTLTAGTDYEVTSYASNKNVGTAKVTVTSKGNYTGTAEGSFIIKPAKANLTKVTAGKKKATAKYTGQTGASYKVVYAVKGTTKYKAVYSKNLTKTISSLKSGTTYKVKVLAYYKDANGKAYYTGYSNMRTVKVK